MSAINDRLRKAVYLKSAYSPADLGDSTGEVAFVGRSNVGKSTVLNALCGQKGLAKVSQTAGRTRTINVFELGGFKWLVDLPGYGFAAGPKADMDKFRTMLDKYLSSRPSLRLVVMLVDAYVGATPLDVKMAKWLTQRDIPFTVAANKCDRLTNSKLAEARDKTANVLQMNPQDIRWISAEKGISVQELMTEVVNALYS